MFDVISKVSFLLERKEKKRASMLLVLIIGMAFVDVVGVASIMPFIAVLSNPDIIETNDILKSVYVYFDFDAKSDFMFFLGICVFAVLIASISFKALTTWLMLRFSRILEYSLTKRFVKLYLRQPFSWYLNRNSADLGKTVLDEVGRVVGGAVMPLLELIAQGCVVVALVGLLIATDPILACVGGLGMGAIYALIYLLVRRRLELYGEQRRLANQLRFQILGEVFGGIKDVKVAGLEQQYLSRFKLPAYEFAISQGAAQAVSQLPRYAMEIIAFGGILSVILFLMRGTGHFQDTLPILSLYALAGYRLMPSMQSLFVNFSALRFGSTTLAHLYSEFRALEQSPIPPKSDSDVAFSKALSIENVSYTYPGATNYSLRSLSLKVKARTTIGLIGATGSGKTTLVDIILGLLDPQSGRVTVDGKAISGGNVPAWQSIIGYVPQHIFLVDDTIAANIAFGVPKHEIDMVEVQRASEIANLHEFVVNSLPGGYQTFVGERGVRLSGGQRQRIGIARALYRKPQLLILDEATAALDNITEHSVMEAVHNLGHKITIILIAHRLSTVRACDQVYILEQGQVLAGGTYEELSRDNDTFRSMLNVDGGDGNDSEAEVY